MLIHKLTVNVARLAYFFRQQLRIIKGVQTRRGMVTGLCLYARYMAVIRLDSIQYMSIAHIEKAKIVWEMECHVFPYTRSESRYRQHRRQIQ